MPNGVGVEPPVGRAPLEALARGAPSPVRGEGMVRQVPDGGLPARLLNLSREGFGAVVDTDGGKIGDRSGSDALFNAALVLRQGGQLEYVSTDGEPETVTFDTPAFFDGQTPEVAEREFRNFIDQYITGMIGQAEGRVGLAMGQAYIDHEGVERYTYARSGGCGVLVVRSDGRVELLGKPDARAKAQAGDFQIGTISDGDGDRVVLLSENVAKGLGTDAMGKLVHDATSVDELPKALLGAYDATREGKPQEAGALVAMEMQMGQVKEHRRQEDARQKELLSEVDADGLVGQAEGGIADPAVARSVLEVVAMSAGPYEMAISQRLEHEMSHISMQVRGGKASPDELQKALALAEAQRAKVGGARAGSPEAMLRHNSDPRVRATGLEIAIENRTAQLHDVRAAAPEGVEPPQVLELKRSIKELKAQRDAIQVDGEPLPSQLPAIAQAIKGKALTPDEMHRPALTVQTLLSEAISDKEARARLIGRLQEQDIFNHAEGQRMSEILGLLDEQEKSGMSRMQKIALMSLALSILAVYIPYSQEKGAERQRAA